MGGTGGQSEVTRHFFHDPLPSSRPPAVSDNLRAVNASPQIIRLGSSELTDVNAKPYSASRCRLNTQDLLDVIRGGRGPRLGVRFPPLMSAGFRDVPLFREVWRLSLTKREKYA